MLGGGVSKHMKEQKALYNRGARIFHVLMNVFLVLACVVLPFQTRWIIVPAFLHGGYWEYGTISLYASEGIVWCAFVAWLFADGLKKWNKQSPWLQEMMHFLIRRWWVRGGVMVWIVLQLLWAPRTVAEISWLIHAMSVFVFYVLLTKSQIQLKVIILAIAIGLSFAGSMGIEQFGSQHIEANTVLGISAQKPEDGGVSVIETPIRRWLRAYGTYPHSNILGGMMVLGLFCWLLFFILADDLVDPIDYWGRLIGIVGVIATSSGLWLSFSRSAWLGWLTGGICVWVVVVIKKRHWFIPVLKWTAISVVVLVVVSYAFDEPFRARTSFLAREPVYGYRLENQSNVIRMAQWKEAYEIGIIRTFGAGTGVGNYTAWVGIIYPSLPVYNLQPFHVTLLLMLAELGLIGFIGIGVLVVQWIRRYGTHAWAVSILIGFAVMSVFDHYWWTLFPGMVCVALFAWLMTQKISTQVQLRIFGK